MRAVKAVLKIISAVITLALALLLAGNIYVIAARALTGEQMPELFGFSSAVVVTGSMSPAIEAGDFIVCRESAGYRPGDIITFRSIDPANYGEVVTHKVQELTSYEGKDAYVTYGTANESADSYPALKEKVIGQYRFRLPKVGALFDYLKSPAGYFVLLFLPFFLLMLSQGIRFFRLFKQYKERQGPRPQGEETPPASIE